MLQKYGLVNSTIQKIWENRTKIITVFENSGSGIKRFGKPEWSDVEKALLKRSTTEMAMYQWVDLLSWEPLFLRSFNFKLVHF